MKTGTKYTCLTENDTEDEKVVKCTQSNYSLIAGEMLCCIGSFVLH